MREHVRAYLTFPALDEFDVGLHALSLEGFGEEVADEGIRVETSEL